MDVILKDLTTSVAVIAPIFILHLLFRRFREPIMQRMHRAVSQTDNPWDDVLVERGIIQACWHLLSSLALQIAFPLLLHHTLMETVLTRLAVVYTAVNVAWIANIGLFGFLAWYATLPIAKRLPIRAYVQVVRILTVAVTVLVAVSALSGRSVVTLVGALGASAAIILLITRDSISSLVSGLQVLASGMVRVGDWIQVGTADGEVIDVTLQAIEIRNWDRTVSYVPMSQLLSGEGFRNYRNQLEQGGMYILKPIYVDISTVINEVNNSSNLTKYRRWIEDYLANDSRINYVQYVRQLPMDRLGMPIEISAFSVHTDWSKHEKAEADILDDLICAMNQFQLKPSHARADPLWQASPDAPAQPDVAESRAPAERASTDAGSHPPSS
ncbi:MAG: mechanosensitive ion channel [Bryobacterales bacterium]|nr:mechanosensitive ion channel [Bryobacterales bacterium]